MGFVVLSATTALGALCFLFATKPSPPRGAAVIEPAEERELAGAVPGATPAAR